MHRSSAARIGLCELLGGGAEKIRRRWRPARSGADVRKRRTRLLRPGRPTPSSSGCRGGSPACRPHHGAERCAAPLATWLGRPGPRCTTSSVAPAARTVTPRWRNCRSSSMGSAVQDHECASSLPATHLPYRPTTPPTSSSCPTVRRASASWHSRPRLAGIGLFASAGGGLLHSLSTARPISAWSPNATRTFAAAAEILDDSLLGAQMTMPAAARRNSTPRGPFSAQR